MTKRPAPPRDTLGNVVSRPGLAKHRQARPGLDLAWPPEGVRDLPPDEPAKRDHVRFPILAQAMLRVQCKRGD